MGQVPGALRICVAAAAAAAAGDVQGGPAGGAVGGTAGCVADALAGATEHCAAAGGMTGGDEGGAVGGAGAPRGGGTVPKPELTSVPAFAGSAGGGGTVLPLRPGVGSWKRAPPEVPCGEGPLLLLWPPAFMTWLAFGLSSLFSLSTAALATCMATSSRSSATVFAAPAAPRRREPRALPPRTRE